MRKIHVLGLALAALLLLGALSVASASAAITTLSAEWLWNNEPIGAALATTAEGKLLLEDTKAPLVGKATVECSGVLDGTVGPGGEGAITELLTALEGGVLVSLKALEGQHLLCETVAGCEKDVSTSEIEVWAINLPWKTLLELIEGGSLAKPEIIALLENGGSGLPGWTVLCLVLSVEVQDVCEAENFGAALVTSAANGTVEATFDEKLVETLQAEAPGLEVKLAKCSQGGVEAGIVESNGAGIIEDPEGLHLSVSSEGVNF